MGTVNVQKNNSGCLGDNTPESTWNDFWSSWESLTSSETSYCSCVICDLGDRLVSSLRPACSCAVCWHTGNVLISTSREIYWSCVYTYKILQYILWFYGDDDCDVLVDFVPTSKVHVKNPQNQKRKQKSILCSYIFLNKVFYC